MRFMSILAAPWALIVLLALSGIACAEGAPTSLPEMLFYEISYGPFDVGKSTMEVADNDDGTVSIITRARSDGWVDDVYPVDDFAESVVEDFTSLVPVRYTLKTREGKGRKHREVLFDHEGQKANYIDHLKQINTEYDIPERVFDPLAAFFYTRRLVLEPGNNQTVPMFDSKKYWPLMVKVIKRQRIEVPAGKFDTVLISPVMESEGIFSRSGDMYIWVTDDARRIPVLIKSKVLIGSIKVKLTGAIY
jgi:hypothetical protein